MHLSSYWATDWPWLTPYPTSFSQSCDQTSCCRLLPFDSVQFKPEEDQQTKKSGVFFWLSFSGFIVTLSRANGTGNYCESGSVLESDHPKKKVFPAKLEISTPLLINRSTSVSLKASLFRGVLFFSLEKKIADLTENVEERLN